MIRTGTMGYGQWYEVEGSEADKYISLRVGSEHSRESIIIRRADGHNYDERPTLVRDLGGVWPKDALTPLQSLDALRGHLGLGELDEHLEEIVSAVVERQKTREREALKQVRSVFGADAMIQVPND